jgi:hypothetical protein
MPTNRQRGRTSCLEESRKPCQLGHNDYVQEELTSGAMNSGVPQNVLVVDPYHISSLHNP